MDNMQKDIIYKTIERKKAETAVKLEEIYQQIARSVMAQPPERLAQAVLQEESPKVNEYIRALRQSMKAEACKAMAECGLSEAAAGIVWANVMNKAGLPKVSLCQKQDVNVAPPSPGKRVGPDAKQKAEINRLEGTRNLGIGVAAIGLTAGIVTCLVVPGWTGLAGVAKVASIVVVGAGVAGAAISQQHIQEINRIVNQVQKEAPSRPDRREVVSQVCKHQCTVNSEIICRWLEQVYSELIVQCEIELAR